VSKERYDVFENADGLLVTTSAELEKPIKADKLWNRIPAAAAGRVAYSNGNINYGSVYTATEALRLYDQLFASMSS
jgi:iron complex transport system substrate-binding protein